MSDKKLLEAEIDSAELTLRIAEACLAMKRPPGTSAQEALGQLRSSQPDIIAGFDRAAMRAAEYFVECINEAASEIRAALAPDQPVSKEGE